MKTYILYIVLTLTLYSCQPNLHSMPPQLEVAIDKTGIVKDHIFDPSKPKVITYFGDIGYLNRWLQYDMPIDSLSKIVERYSEFEFVFYLRVKGEPELNRAMELAISYNVEIPIYLDDKDKFMNAIIGDSRVGLVTYILGSNNKQYDSGILGGPFKPRFEDTIKNAIKQLKLDNNGL